ncbi:double-strand-break repair protein rad21 homolog isoform X2 [Eupeodes corollae]|uniref:double-strand-break repair protein rad21 homolog isoform X2 n=1 Tax=Eupeodes corollae TaxID=290404 RepID=UPI00249208CC|nr:double-strand-break repair protein rad21 homolog isoform X2 [Eupeodes corollae]
MFYAHIVLAKKGPLARIWLAAHWDKKLTKAHVFETNIEQSVDGIMQPKVKLALRTSGHLLLGVVRIYSRKAKYLLADCNEAFVKIKMAFRPGMVDLPEGHREAAVNAITLPEVFHDFDTALPELNDIDIEAQFSINQSRADEITMREDYGSMSMSLHDDGFGDMGFDADTPDLVRDGMDPNIDEHLFAEELGKDIDQTKETLPGSSRDIVDDINDPNLDGDGFGDEFGQPAVGLFEGDLFGEPALPAPAEASVNLPANEDNSDDDMDDHFDTGAPSPMPSSIGSRPPSVLGQDNVRAPSTTQHQQPTSPHHEHQDENEHQPEPDLESENPEANGVEQSTLLHNEEESFALAPVDASAYRGVTKAKRKRKLIVDEVKNISGEEMKAQLANTSDIVTTLDLAPPTKRLMYWKETGGVEKLFSLPSRDIPARGLFANYTRHIVSRLGVLEDFSMLGPADLLALDQIQQEHESPTTAASKRGRKRKGAIQAEVVAAPTLMPPPPPAIVPADETLTHSLAEPDLVRDAELNPRVSAVSLEFNQNDSLMPPPPTPGFDSLRSPGHMFPMPELSGLDPMTPLGGVPMTPGNLPHGIVDIHDDFHHSGLTPADLHHGGMTPHHSSMENIDALPNLPVDQVSSILNEAENMPDTSTDNVADNMADNMADNLDLGDLTLVAPANKSADLASEWNTDYEFPQSVGVHQPGDEQMENETDEQFEERVLNKRAAQMFVQVRSRLQKNDTLMLSDMTHRNTRKQAAQKFYSLLVLKKFRALSITQSEPYADILVEKGPMFDNPKL